MTIVNNSPAVYNGDLSKVSVYCSQSQTSCDKRFLRFYE